MYRIPVAVFALFLLTACNGHIEEYTDQRTYPSDPGDTNSADGVRVYMPSLMKVSMKFTTRPIRLRSYPSNATLTPLNPLKSNSSAIIPILFA